MSFIQFSLVLLMMSISVIANAQQGQNNRLINETDDNQVSLNFDEVDLRVFISMISEVTNRSFVIDPRVKGKVSIISGGTLSKDQLYDVFLSVLEVNNFAAVDSGSVTKIIPTNVIKQRPTPTVFSSSKKPSSPSKGQQKDEQITQIIQLEYAPVQELVPIIRPLIPPTSHFAPHLPSNSIVVTDTTSNIQRVLEIIRSIDIPDKRSNLNVVYLNHAKATDIATTIQGIFTGPSAAQASNEAPITVQAMASINALIVSAPDDTYEKIWALIGELDIERELQSDVNVIYLKHAKAPDLVSILNETSKSANDNGIQDFSVQADEATNSIIVKATGNKFQSVKDVVDQLDVRRPQVFVETVIAEVSFDQSSNLGIEWQLGDSANPISLADESDTSTSIGSATLGTDFNLNSSGLNYSLFDFKKYRLDVIVNALRSDVNSNILSTPTILTLDNEEAEIVVGQEVPFVTGRFDNGGFNSAQNTDANGNTTVVNNSNRFQTIERKDVGIKLKIKPQISEGDTIQLDVSQEISSVSTTTIQGQADLITNRRSIEAVVQVDDGQVIVLGGLIQDDIVDTEEWVPFLGKIPIIGRLFRNNRKVAIKRNLMVFLKPRIIRSSEDLVGYSKDKYDAIRGETIKLKKKDQLNIFKSGEQPVLQEYDNVVNDGRLTTESRNKKLIKDRQKKEERKERE